MKKGRYIIYFLVFIFSLLLCISCSLGGDIDTWHALVEKKPAGEEQTPSLAFTLSDYYGGYSVGRGTETAANVIIPAEYNGLPVTEIAYTGFYNYAGLKSITIPDSVMRIGDSAFVGCGGLTSIILPDNLAEIGYSAFASCSNLASILIPDSVMEIYQGAFYNCGDLANVFYGGADISAWNNIGIDSANDPLTSSTIYCYSATQPVTAGNYWRWVGGVPAVWN